MFGSDFWNSVTFADLMALSGVVAMIVGGATLFASGIPTRSDALEHRIKIALPRAGVKQAEAAPGARPLAILLKLPSLGGGLTEAEHRQVIRTYTSLGVIADRAVPFFILSRLVLAASFGVVILLAGLHSGVAALHGWVLMLAAIGSAIAGWLLPIFVISHLLKRRTKAIAAGLPNALELLVVCVEAGLSLEDGLQRVARELQESQPALAEELALTWAEVNILPDRTQALINLADQVDNPSMRTVIGMLSQSMRFGTPLGQSLRTGATEMRNDQLTQLEERASRLPALMTIPVMLFIMPTIFLIIGGPAALRLIDMFAGTR